MGVLASPLVVICSCCGFCFKFWQSTLTRCKFCEKKMKKKEYKEHRENCFTENLATIQGFKEAALPKECPKDPKHILYQWPEKKCKGQTLSKTTTING